MLGNVKDDDAEMDDPLGSVGSGLARRTFTLQVCMSVCLYVTMQVHMYVYIYLSTSTDISVSCCCP